MNLKTLGFALLSLYSVASFAQDEQPAPDPEQQPADAQQAQQPAVSPEQEYETLLRETRALRAYNALLQRQIEMQQRDLQDVQTAIGQVPNLERQLPPLLIRMVDGLEEFVDMDVPFLQEERNERIANLYLMIESPEVSDAQKLRRILEAWSIEVEYGNAFQTEQGEVALDGGQPRTVDLVILGRIGLLFQSADAEAITGAWDHDNQQWVVLGSEHRNPVRQAIRMARSQIAPDMLMLPVAAPTTAQ